jgi:ABC-2 type transport system permease protein
MTAATVSLNPAAGTARPSAPSLGLLAGLEMRKSLSTRSGRAVGLLAVLLGPVGVAIGSLGGEGEAPAAAILGFTGMLTGLVLLALGVLSTAGEWTHKSVQTTYLLVPQRGRVVSAKVGAMVVLGAVFAAIGAVLTMGMMVVIPDPVGWTAVGRAFAVAVLAGAAFAVIGAGIGAALGNSPAALTGTYLVVLGVLPILHAFKPTIAEKIDPVTSVVDIAQFGWSTTPVLVIAGWVAVSTAVGAYVTQRRAVQ